ncbi:hypothetical protein L1987_29363 [Smallanthus sonchifolius]|uniref:Uncharacterized protein n=1 Tax=Smallanthus sonchifolius TaxID=185202 RepID=A0ACB9HZV1_9ASTR|nr:hypothetical protein L1987_29363 [Smallanthus sonchifolius]
MAKCTSLSIDFEQVIVFQVPFVTEWKEFRDRHGGVKDDFQMRGPCGMDGMCKEDDIFVRGDEEKMGKKIVVIREHSSGKAEGEICGPPWSDCRLLFLTATVLDWCCCH